MSPQPIQNKLISYLIILVGFVAGYVWYSQNSGDISVPSVSNSADDLKKFNELRINYSVLTDPGYSSLQIYGDLPVRPQGGGKRDLFAPF